MISKPVALCPTSSSSDLSVEIAQSNCPSLLSESFSLWSVYSNRSLSVPPFPGGCMVPMFSVGLNNSNTLTGVSGVEGLYDSYSSSPLTTTIPTSPRLRTILTENLCIKKWVRNVASAEPAQDYPWASQYQSDVLDWVPEGSLHSPEAFHHALFNARTRRSDLNDSVSVDDLSPLRRYSYRDALVFDREITLRSGETTQRWSVQVPAQDMDPEMVEMMLELQKLNAFFKDNSDTDDSSLPEPSFTIEPPSLFVSNSQTVIPISLDSSSALYTPSPPSPCLAERRGRKVLPQLKCPHPEEDPYPGIPTAFLGTPSAYSPSFDWPSPRSTSSMNIDDMISSLRNQGANLYEPTTDLPVFNEELVANLLPLPLTPTTPVSALADEDDWAFAYGLMEHPELSTIANVDTSLQSASEHLDGPDVSTSTERGSQSRLLSDESVHSQLIWHQTPAMAASPSSAVSSTSFSSISAPRGILKRCKNVRFASVHQNNDSALPEHPVLAIELTSFPETPPNVRPAVSPEPSSLTLSAGPRLGFPVLPRPMSVAASPRQKPPTPKSAPRKPFLKRGSPPIISRPFPTTRTTARHSLGNMMRPVGKENKGRASLSPKALSRVTLDENTFRKGSGSSKNPVGQKSRMPVPLRNILTRFK